MNYFDLAGHFYLVDLPGYGYAKASKTDIAKWNAMTMDYLMGRASLKRVFQLVDSRHGSKPNDIDLMEDFDRAAVSYQVILTKADKDRQSQSRGGAADNPRGCAQTPLPPILMSSSPPQKNGA